MHKKNIINRLKFWFHIGIRYIRSRDKTGKTNIIFLSLFLGISGGLMILVVVLGIMNGFQENHISRRIEVGSYHIVISKKNFGSFKLIESLKLKKLLYKNIKGLQAVIPFSDREVIVRLKKGYYNEEQILKIRALDPDEISKDKRFQKYFKLLYGDDIKINEYSLILGEAMFDRMLAKNNTVLYITPDISLKSYKKEGIPFIIKNVFNTGSYDYDRYWGFISIYSMIPLAGKAEVDSIGIKLNNLREKNRILKELKSYLGEGYSLQTAQEINRGYFTALRIEKVMIILLFIMIFMMVATNTFGAIKLNIIEKKIDISIIKAIGASPRDIEVIFVIESLFLGFGGSFVGVFLGVLVAYNITNIFLFVEFIINNILSFSAYLLEYMIPGIYFPFVKIYDNSIYYQSEFLVKINFSEILVICLLIISMTIFAAFLPVSGASKLRPNEIIKN